MHSFFTAHGPLHLSTSLRIHRCVTHTEVRCNKLHPLQVPEPPCIARLKGRRRSSSPVGALREPTSTFVLCSRNLDAGKAAVQKLKAAGVTAKVDLLQLEVTDDGHIAAAVKYVEDTYGKLDVLINNAGVLRHPQGDLTSVRQTYNELLEVNLTSVAVIITAFIPLLYQSADPKVINVSSGLGSIQNSLTRKMGRAPAYGASKIGLNGLTVHMQVSENDRIEAEGGAPSGKPRIRFYVCAPGVLKTAFLGDLGKAAEAKMGAEVFRRLLSIAKEPEEGAEVIVRLLSDDEHTYEGGSYWAFEGGEMRQVPW